MKCRDITTQAHALIDGELSLGRQLSIRFHLLICKYCRRYVDQLVTTVNILRNSELLDEPEQQLSDEEIDQIVARLKDSNIS